MFVPPVSEEGTGMLMHSTQKWTLTHRPLRALRRLTHAGLVVACCSLQHPMAIWHEIVIYRERILQGCGSCPRLPVNLQPGELVSS